MESELEERQPWAADPAYSRRRAAGYIPPRTGPSNRTVMMEAFLKYLRIQSVISMLCCFVLLYDFLGPEVIKKEKVITDMATIKRLGIRKTSDLLFTDGAHHFPLHFGELQYFPGGPELTIFKSSLFSILIRIENEAQTYQVNNLATLYRNFFLAPFVLFGLGVLGAFNKGEREFRFNTGIVMILVFLLNIYLLFVSQI